MKFGIPGLVLVFSKTQLQSKEKIVPGFTTQVDEIWNSNKVLMISIILEYLVRISSLVKTKFK
jgi:hypothetical protein